MGKLTVNHCYGMGVCRSGFARFTNTRYSNKKEDINNTYMHLTNVAIQKHAPGFDQSKVGGAMIIMPCQIKSDQKQG